MEKIFEKDGIISANVFSTYRDGTQIGESVMIVIDSETGDIHDTKASVVPFNQVSADYAFKEGEDNRSLNKWCEVHRRAFAKDYEAVGLDFDEKGDYVLEEFLIHKADTKSQMYR